MRVNRLGFGGICAVVAVLGVTMPVDAGLAYVAGSSNEFGTIDLNTGVFTSIGTLALPSGDVMYGMGFASNGTLYGIDEGNGETSSHLWSINPATAAVTDLGGIGFYAIGATVHGNTAYALGSQGDDVLYTVDLTTTTTTNNGSTGFVPDGLMAFDSSGQLFAEGQGTLYQVNPMNASSTPIGTPPGFSNAILFSGFFAGNTLYGFGQDFDYNNVIYTIDTTTGKGTFVSDTQLPNSNFVEAAAYLAGSAAPVPEPASLTLMVLGGLGLAGYARRRRLGRVHA